MRKKKVDPRIPDSISVFEKYIGQVVPETEEFIRKLMDFIHTEARLPCGQKNFLPDHSIELSTDMDRNKVIEYLQNLRQANITADLAFYAYRDMQTCDWMAFVKAAIERNPVSLELTDSMSIDHAYNWLEQMDDTSIYDAKRLAQPDEVANYNSGDGLEKAFLLANVIRKKMPEQDMELKIDDSVILLITDKQYKFSSAKGLKKNIQIPAGVGVSSVLFKAVGPRVFLIERIL